MMIQRVWALIGASVIATLAACSPVPVNGVPKDARIIEVEGSASTLALWTRKHVSFYAISQDHGETYGRPHETDYKILRRRDGAFDPLLLSPILDGSYAGNLRLVQFVVPPLPEFKDRIERMGARVLRYFPNHAWVVDVGTAPEAAISELPYVRWIGPFDASFRLSPRIGDATSDMGTYRVVAFSPEARAQVARAHGVDVVAHGAGNTVELRMTAAEAVALASQDGVLFLEPTRAIEEDMDITRELGGANYIETVAGYTGFGVRAEVMDGGVLATHTDFAAHPLIIHTGTAPIGYHGTATTGVIFGDGTGDPTARGMMPDAQGIFIPYGAISSDTTRYELTQESISPTYEAVFQSNSWGHSRTLYYDSYSEEMDQIVFDLDFLIVQSQSNSGDQYSRPEAWAKNVISIGGVRHFNNGDPSDDSWTWGASIGPAEDGRLKPELAHFYDASRTLSSSGGYADFSGTSNATPVVAGHLGLFLQMWADGLFGNPALGGTVFENRPHATTAKAMLINTAQQYEFKGFVHDLSRTHQGWGLPNLRTLYDDRGSFLITDETIPLKALQTYDQLITVPAGSGALRATLVYNDPPAAPGATKAAVNDLTLRVVAPSMTEYWGNHGLNKGNWSTPGGHPNTVDTVENVFVRYPAQGTWLVQVVADAVVQDGHVETPALDADFALVIRTSASDAL